MLVIKPSASIKRVCAMVLVREIPMESPVSGRCTSVVPCGKRAVGVVLFRRIIGAVEDFGKVKARCICKEHLPQYPVNAAGKDLVGLDERYRVVLHLAGMWRWDEDPNGFVTEVR